MPITLELPAITVPTEPVALTSQPIPIQPSYIVDPVFRRERREWLTETGDTGRRLAQSKQRLATTLTWENLDSTDRDTIKSFLLARVDAVESFATNDHVHGDREWFVRLGRVEVRQTSPNGWGIRVEADEIIVKRYFTVGLSSIGGADPIR